jgi:hypothetical protein
VNSQKEWELETRLIKLEGGGLDNLMSGFNDKIDSIFSGAIVKLDKVNAKARRKKMIDTGNSEFAMRGQSWGAAQSQFNYDHDQQCRGMQGAALGGCAGMAGTGSGLTGGFL